MAIAIILGIILISLSIGSLVFATVKLHVNPRSRVKVRDPKDLRAGIIGISAAVVLFIMFIFIPFSFHQVDSGEVAVVKHMGEAKEVKTAGVYFDFWVTEKYQKYDAKVQTLEFVAPSYSNDKQTMDITMTLQYQIKVDRVMDIAINYGSLDLLNSRIQSVVLERTKSELSKYSADQIIQDRAAISPEVTSVVSDAINENYYINILTVSLTNIDFSDAYEQSVEQTMISNQEVKKAEAEAQKALIEAENRVAVAEQEAAAKAAQAQGEADAIRIKAEAEAKAIQIKSLEVARMLGLTVVDEDGTETIKPNLTIEEATLISEYLKYIEYLEAWDGKLPDVVGDGSDFIFGISKKD